MWHGQWWSKRINFLLLAANQRCRFYFDDLFSLQQSLSYTTLCQKQIHRRCCAGTEHGKFQLLEWVVYKVNSHVKPEGHHGSPDGGSQDGQLCSILLLREVNLLHPSSACSPQLLPDPLFLLLGLPQWLSHQLCPLFRKLPEERADKGRAAQLELLKAVRYPPLLLRRCPTPLFRRKRPSCCPLSSALPCVYHLLSFLRHY